MRVSRLLPSFATESPRKRNSKWHSCMSQSCQFQTLALGNEKVSKANVLKSGLGPGQKHDLTTEAAEIDAGVDLARGRERETVDHDGMDGAVAQ